MRKIGLVAVLTWGCSSEPLLPFDVVILPGHETDLWSAQPVPTRVEVALVKGDQRTTLAQAPAPTTGLTIASEVVPIGTTAKFETSALDATGQVSARGSSVTFYIGTIEGISVPVFAARAGGWSRPPDALEHAHRKPVVVTMNQFVIAAGGDAVAGVDGSVPDFYDTANWQTRRSQPPLPRSPKSAAVVLGAILTVDETGATWLDLTNDQTLDAMAPEGLSFGEIAGGDAVTMPDGTVFIVGATRGVGDPTTKVLRIGSDRAFRAIALSSARLGAAAGAVGNKLVVAGGSAMGAGVEVLNETQTAFVTLGVAAEATAGLGLAPLDGTMMVLAGGKDPMTGTPAAVRTLDLSCGATCTMTELSPMPVALERTRAFRIEQDKVVVTGDAEDGETRAFTIAISTPAVAEHPLRERRRWASALVLPNGQVGLVGGVAVDGTDAAVSSLEAYIP